MLDAVELALRLGVGLVLLAASAAKLRSPRELPDVLRGYAVPARLAAPAAAVLVVAEVAVGGLLVAGVAPRAVSAAAVALGLVFVGAVGRMQLRGVRRLRCGCFGAAERSTGFLLARALAFTALASLAALAAYLGTPDLAADATLAGAAIFLAVAVAVLTALVLALYRQVGVLTLRIGPAQGALELPGEGPELGIEAPALEGLTLHGSELVVFFSPGCRLCRELRPGVLALAREGVEVLVVDEGEDAGAFERWNVPGSPFVVHLMDGRVAATGTVNTLEQLDGLVALGTARTVRATA